MTTEHHVRALLLGASMSSLLVTACRDDRELATERRPYAAPGSPRSQTVQVRNSCPEAVVIAISSTRPEPSTPTMTLRSTKVEAVTIEQGARIWLRYDGRYDEEHSVAPSGAVEVGYQCNGIYDRNGGL